MWFLAVRAIRPRTSARSSSHNRWRSVERSVSGEPGSGAESIAVAERISIVVEHGRARRASWHDAERGAVDFDVVGIVVANGFIDEFGANLDVGPDDVLNSVAVQVGGCKRSEMVGVITFEAAVPPGQIEKTGRLLRTIEDAGFG